MFTSILVDGAECAVRDHALVCSERDRDGVVSYPIRSRSDCIAEMRRYLPGLFALVPVPGATPYANEGLAAYHWAGGFVEVTRYPEGRLALRSSLLGRSGDTFIDSPDDLSR